MFQLQLFGCFNLNIQPQFLKKRKNGGVLGLLVCYSPYLYYSFLTFSVLRYLLVGFDSILLKKSGLTGLLIHEDGVNFRYRNFSKLDYSYQ